MSLLWARCSWTHFYPYSSQWQMLGSEGHQAPECRKGQGGEARLTSTYRGLQAHQPLTTHHTGLALNCPELAL